MATSTIIDKRFEDFRVIITGASSGIGLATAEYYHERGAKVALLARRKQLLDSIVADKFHNERAFAIGVDVTNDTQLTEAIKQSAELLGGIDVLVNNAGGIGGALAGDPFDVTKFDAAFALNTRSTVVASNAAIPFLLESKGSVVNVSSIAAHRPDGGMPYYCASKAAVDSVTQSYALAYAPKGVRFNTVNPAAIDTPIFENVQMSPDQVAQFIGPLHPLNRVGQPSEVAATIAFLSSREVGFITGVSLFIDGGVHFSSWLNKGSLIDGAK